MVKGWPTLSDMCKGGIRKGELLVIAAGGRMSPKERKGEKVGGGFFVFRRGKKTGRIGCKRDALPFEHPTLAAAEAEAVRLANLYKGETFVIIGDLGIEAFTPKEETSNV